MRELEIKIAAWRAALTAEFGDRDDVVQELEAHLRDGIDELTQAGVAPTEAFVRVTAQLGDARAMADEFRRMPSRWFGGIRSQETKALAYASGLLGVAGFAFYLAFSIWGLVTYFGGRRVPDDFRRFVFWQAMAFALLVVCALAIRASNRFLEQPNARDLRGVVSFNLLALWMLAGSKVDAMALTYTLKVTVLMTLCGMLVMLWRRWMTHMHGGRPQ